MPTNLYGPGDNYHPKNSHVLPALIRRFHEAKEAGTPEVEGLGHGHARGGNSSTWTTWPTRAPSSSGAEIRRTGSTSGRGRDVTIRELTEIVAEVTGYAGRDHLGRDQARRHPAQAPRRLEDVGPRLEGADRAQGGDQRPPTRRSSRRRSPGALRA